MTTSQRNEKQVAGPELPPGFLQQSSNKASEPAFVGPALPPGFQRETEESVLPVTGPALPPGFKPVKRPVIGPALPACAEEADDRCEPLPADATGATSGGGGGAFKRHHSDSDDDDGDVIGPMLPSHPQVEYSAAEEFDMRAKKMKEKIRKEVSLNWSCNSFSNVVPCTKFTCYGFFHLNRDSEKHWSIGISLVTGLACLYVAIWARFSPLSIRSPSWLSVGRENRQYQLTSFSPAQIGLKLPS